MKKILAFCLLVLLVGCEHHPESSSLKIGAKLPPEATPIYVTPDSAKYRVLAWVGPNIGTFNLVIKHDTIIAVHHVVTGEVEQ